MKKNRDYVYRAMKTYKDKIGSTSVPEVMGVLVKNLDIRTKKKYGQRFLKRYLADSELFNMLPRLCLNEDVQWTSAQEKKFDKWLAAWATRATEGMMNELASEMDQAELTFFEQQKGNVFSNWLDKEYSAHINFASTVHEQALRDELEQAMRDITDLDCCPCSWWRWILNDADDDTKAFCIWWLIMHDDHANPPPPAFVCFMESLKNEDDVCEYISPMMANQILTAGNRTETTPER